MLALAAAAETTNNFKILDTQGSPEMRVPKVQQLFGQFWGRPHQAMAEERLDGLKYVSFCLHLSGHRLVN